MKLPVVVIHGGATVLEEKYHPAILEAVKRAPQERANRFSGSQWVEWQCFMLNKDFQFSMLQKPLC